MNKTIAIMQPYFLPYIGYWQLMNAVDEFVVYDNIQFTKKGWINRNRFLLNGEPETFTLPLKKDSDYLNVSERYLSDNYKKDSERLLRRFKSAYLKAPYFNDGFEILRECLLYQERNLFKFIYNSIKTVKDFLEIDTDLIVSSSLEIDHSLNSSEKVLAICQSLTAGTYINPIGGIELYKKEEFLSKGIKLNFLNSNHFEYLQFKNEFCGNLSIIDLIMFNDRQVIQEFLGRYRLL